MNDFWDPEEVVEEIGENSHSFFNLSSTSLGSLFVRNWRDDLRREKLFEGVSEPNKIAISPPHAPVYFGSSHLKFQIA